MKTLTKILDKYLKMCYESHGIKISDKYITYLHRAMKIYGNRMYWKGFAIGLIMCFLGYLLSRIF